jgi:hypothetical protein
MIREFALPSLRELFHGDDTGLANLIWMKDGASPHFGGLPLLDEHFAGRWMGRGTRRFPAPYPWPHWARLLFPISKPLTAIACRDLC